MTPKNSTNPRVWVSKDGLTKYVLKTDLDFYLSKGFEFGRKKYMPRHNAQGSVFNIGVKQLEKVKKVKKIKELFETGLSINEIVKETNMTRQVVTYNLRK